MNFVTAFFFSPTLLLTFFVDYGMILVSEVWKVKQFLKIWVIVALLFLFSVSANAETEIKVIVNGVLVQSDALPKIINDRTFLPVRSVAEAFDAEVSFDGSTKTVTITKNDMKAELTVGSDKIYLGDKIIKIDALAFIDNDRCYVPVRAFADAFGFEIFWNGETKTVTLKSFDTAVREEKTADGSLYIYDEKERVVFFSNGTFWESFEYDKNGNTVFYENSNGFWIKDEFDESGKVTLRKTSALSYIKYSYDNYGNLIYMEDSNGNWSKTEYNEKGLPISFKNSYGYSENFLYE